jgi:Fic family protein
LASWNVHFDLAVDLSSPHLVRLVERAHALADVIQDIPIPPYLQLELDAINIMRAVRGTTAIEGAQISVTEVQRIVESPQSVTLPEARRRDEQEVRNAQEAMFYIASLLDSQPEHPVTQELICQLHTLITKDINYAYNTPGVYRSHPVNAGDYQPPASGDEVRRLMSEFVEWFRSPPATNWDPIVRALAAHFYLISIHPFGDGNGRTSRALESFLLYQGKVNARSFYSLANYYYQNRSDYVWHLDNARFNSQDNLTPFIAFGLEGLVSELQAVHAQVIDEVKLISFRDYAREQFLHKGRLGTKAGERLFHFLIALGRHPMPISEIRARTAPPASLYRKVSMRTLQRDIALLRDEGLVKIEDGAVVPNLELMEQFTALRELKMARGFSADMSESTQATVV